MSAPFTNLRFYWDCFRTVSTFLRNASPIRRNLPRTKKPATGRFFASLRSAVLFDSRRGNDPYGNRLHFCLWQKLLFRSVKPSRARLHRSLAFSLFDSRTDKKIQAHRCVPVFFGDPYGNRTHVTAVKGRCLNRLTNGPGSGDLT